MNRQPFLVAVGDNCVDYYVQTRTGYPGGNPVNVAVYFTRLGGRAAYIGAVGTDEGGALICDGLRRKNVDISHIHTVQGRTAVTRVALRDGDRVFLEYNEGVMADFTLTEADMDFLCTADMVVGGISGHGERYFPRIRSDGIPAAFDFSVEYDDSVVATIFPCVEVAFFSYDGGDAAGFLRRMRERGPAVCIATLGADGSMAYDGQQFYRQGIVPCQVVDTMGAGDSFATAMLVSLLQGMEKTGGRWADPACRALLLPDALEAAAAFSAKNCLVHGAFDCGVPVPASVHDRIYEGV